MRNVFRDSNVIGRFGGDEFAVMLTDANNAKITAVLERFRIEIDAMDKFIYKTSPKQTALFLR